MTCGLGVADEAPWRFRVSVTETGVYAISHEQLVGAGLADDMQKGIIDRFRSLPMSRSAVRC